LTALDFEVPTELLDRLTELSAPPVAAPYAMVSWQQGVVNSGVRGFI
jgi:hypothetical protein